ncbi:MAG TPA: hypothetical protein VD763_04960, partial [Candidatus Saccharimonadales bacterium]|nr:hypothetical protein [Candidatus Saccharimonadales bacterium]
HILALRKSEPSLEDVFVELVGRGFGDEDGAERSNGTDRDAGKGLYPDDDLATDDAEEAAARDEVA